MPRQEDESGAAGKNKAGEIRRAPPFGLFAEAGGRRPEDAHPAPVFPCRKHFFRIVIRPPSGDHGDFVSFFRQRDRQFTKILAGGHDIGIKRLIKQKNFQIMKLNVPFAGF